MPVRIVVPLFRAFVAPSVAVVVLSGAVSFLLHDLVGGIESLVSLPSSAFLVILVVFVHTVSGEVTLSASYLSKFNKPIFGNVVLNQTFSLPLIPIFSSTALFVSLQEIAAHIHTGVFQTPIQKFYSGVPEAGPS